MAREKLWSGSQWVKFDDCVDGTLHCRQRRQCWHVLGGAARQEPNKDYGNERTYALPSHVLAPGTILPLAGSYMNFLARNSTNRSSALQTAMLALICSARRL